MRRPWNSLALLPTMDGYDRRLRTVSVCPSRALSAPIRACVAYAVRSRGMPAPPVPGSLWEWPAMFADVWEIVASEWGWIERDAIERERALKAAQAAARAGHGG